MMTETKPPPGAQTNHFMPPRKHRTITCPTCRICRTLETSGRHEGGLYINHYGDHPIHCPHWRGMSIDWRIHISRRAKYCTQCFSPKIFVESVTERKSHYRTECPITQTNKHVLSCLNASCLQHSWTCPKHTDENRPLMSTFNGKRQRWKTPHMRMTNYPPAVILSPTLAEIIDSKLQELQSSAHFPESAQELKTELAAYEKNLQDATAIGSTAPSGHPPQRELNLDHLPNHK